MSSPIRSLPWFLTDGLWKQSSFWWPGSSLSPLWQHLLLLRSVHSCVAFPASLGECQFLPASGRLPLLSTLSGTFEPHEPASSLLLSRLGQGGHSWPRWIKSSLSHSELPIIFCLVFLQSSYSLSVRCHKLPIHLARYLSFLPTYRL